MADKSDIRKWFLKQPHKESATPEKKVVDMASTPEVRKTSKYFSSEKLNKTGEKISPKVEKISPSSTKLNTKTSPSTTAKIDKTPPSKRKESDSDDFATDRTIGPSPKKARTDIDKKDTRDLKKARDDVSVKKESESFSSAGKGRGKGPPPPLEESKPSPAGGGRGRGRGGGGGGGGGRGGGGFYGQPKATPPHKGEKDVPEGAEDCLAGLTFVISGTLDSLEREEAEDLIKRHGGRVTGSVSKKTSYLLADEDVGGQKSQKAKQLGVSFLSEDALFDMIRASKPAKTVKNQDLAIKTAVKEVAPKDAIVRSSALGGPSHPTDPSKGKAYESPSKAIMQRKGSVADSEAWPQKHRPRSSAEIIGNQSIVKQLHDWLKNWDDEHLHTEKKGKKRGGGSSAGNAKKAVLLSGTPGIGKTTSARLICKELGFEAIEVNASDNRGKSDSNVGKGIGGATSNAIKEMISNASLAITNKDWSGHKTKAVLIMDEVDGMSGGDRGGVADLIASIKMSKIPIICICNDRYSQKLKSLVNYCLPLNYRKPTKQQMAKRLHAVAQSEGLQVDEIALEELADRVGGDMRMALNQLQYMSLRARVIKYADVKERLVSSAKDEEISPFNAVDKLMGYDGGRLRMDERLDASMSDPDLVPLLIQENYLNYCPSAAGRDESGVMRMDLIARAADSIANGDIVNVQIRRYGQWQHSQMGAFSSSIIPAALMHGRREVLSQGERNFNRFGGWLGKNSSYGKKLRLLEDARIHILASHVCQPTRETLRLDYSHYLALFLTYPLRTMPKEMAVQMVVDVMEEYSLTQQDYDTIIDVIKFQGHQSSLEGVQTAVKTALTKAFKQRQHDGRVKSADLLPPMPNLPGNKKTPKKRAALNFTPFSEDGIPEDTEDLEESEEEDEGATEEAPPSSLLKINGATHLNLNDESVKQGSKSSAKNGNSKRSYTKNNENTLRKQKKQK